MKTFMIIASAFLALSVSAFAEENAFPFVTASPSYSNVGSVKYPMTRMTMITFMNMSSEDIPFFNAHCMGDLSVFNCSSSCFRLMPYGSCSVMVTFSPRFGDGMQKWITVQGTGGGAFANADVYGTDEK